MSPTGADGTAHRRAIGTMVLVTLMWSLAGVVTRHLQAARAFEVTFWRSAFCALAIGVYLVVTRGGRSLAADVRHGGWFLAGSSLCWATMFTMFMLALSVTDVATVLVTMAVGPLVTAVVARVFLKHALSWHGWAAISIAGAGMAWMQGAETSGGGSRAFGVAMAAMVPLAAASNFTLMQAVQRSATASEQRDRAAMPVAVLCGAVLSALATLPAAWPLRAAARDIGLLAGLGVVQLAIPCLLVIGVSRRLAAPEIALLGLLEVIFGVAWAWLGAHERPGPQVLQGGAVVLGAMAYYQVDQKRRERRLQTSSSE